MVELRRLERKNALNAGSNPAVPIARSVVFELKIETVHSGSTSAGRKAAESGSGINPYPVHKE